MVDGRPTGVLEAQLLHNWSNHLCVRLQVFVGANTCLPYFLANCVADIPRLTLISLQAIVPYFMVGMPFGAEFFRYDVTWVMDSQPVYRLPTRRRLHHVLCCVQILAVRVPGGAGGGLGCVPRHVVFIQPSHWHPAQ